MSNKNLKIYRIQFIAQLKQLQFKVKFPCQIKMLWTRSNEKSQSTLIPVENGLANFNQTIKMYVNMYFDTTTNLFVNKKCLFSFLIVTEKGEKSAGTFSYDLAEFFNKRIYEVEEDFVLQKCPIPDTKMKMKLYYEESTETGYDSMSRISTSEQLDISTASMDLNQLNNSAVQSTNMPEQKPNSSKISESDTTSKGVSSKDKEETESMDLLNQSDLGIQVVGGASGGAGNQKIQENIQALNKLTGKINEFVGKCSSNIKTEMENLKHKNAMLQQAVSTSKFELNKANTEKQQQKSAIAQLKKQLTELKLSFEVQSKKDKELIEQLTHKSEQADKLTKQMQKSMEEKGQSQTSFLTDLKKGFEDRQSQLKQKVSTLNQQLSEQKKQKAELQQKLSTTNEKLKQTREKLGSSSELNRTLQSRESQRQRQLSQLREKLENVYENILKSFGQISS